MQIKMISLDWRSMKIYQIRGLFIPLYILLFGLYMPLIVFPMSVFVFLSFSVNPFAVEEKGELNYLYLTLPVSRRMIVTGRYLLSLIMMALGFICAAILMPIANIFSTSKWYVGVKGYFLLISACYLLYAVLNLCMFPILFKIGYQKGKFLGFYFPVVFSTILVFIFNMISTLPGNETLMFDIIMWATENIVLVGIISIIAATLLMFISYSLSLLLYSKREF